MIERPGNRSAIEAFRVRYEAEHGITDLTRTYSSQWPDEMQDWFISHRYDLYFAALPPFAKAFIRQLCIEAKQRGRLDDAPQEAIRLYIKGGMELDEEQGRSR
jgi:hypothetical protein